MNHDWFTRVLSSLAAGTAVAFGPGLASADVVVGGFDSARAGSVSLLSGSLTADLRASILASHPCASITGANALTPAYLDTLDVLLISSAAAGGVAAAPLTLAEQAALQQFVLDGGHALILVDNNTFAGGGTDAINESFLDPFGLDSTGTINANFYPATVLDPPASPATNGPFGLIGALDGSVPGWFDGIGPDAVTLATFNGNGQPMLAEIAAGQLGPGSGAVLLFSDTSLIFDGFSSDNVRNIINNFIAAADDSCDGDADANGVVDVNDIAYVIFRLGNVGPVGTVDGDADCNGIVDINDIAYVIFRLGNC